ncbi:MAG: DUF2203 domain-containing protein [Chloroflexota bacterium]
MTRFYSIDEANAAIPEVERILMDLRDQRAELIVLRDAILRAPAAEHGALDRDPTQAPQGAATSSSPNLAPSDVRRLRLRMQGLIDQMQAGVTRLVERDITLREIEAGLIDFPALVSGRQVWLCWRLGESDVAWWHELGDGFGGRVALTDLI